MFHVCLEKEMLGDNSLVGRVQISPSHFSCVYEGSCLGSCGQGTAGLELLRKIPDLGTIIVPIGGGGLISGISVAAKSVNPNIKIIGVQPERASAVYQLTMPLIRLSV
jgi:1-aminocyclopropane-1-carboxylate deaminase/D-cysteine desulfhydrase-like pyridoxal-dependent ACC family enzyme